MTAENAQSEPRRELGVAGATMMGLGSIMGTGFIRPAKRRPVPVPVNCAVLDWSSFAVLCYSFGG